jgi:hypothetical protein
MVEVIPARKRWVASKVAGESMEFDSWSIFSCCQYEHRFDRSCLVRSFTDSAGVKREIVEVTDKYLYIITTWPSGAQSNRWKVTREGWHRLWDVAKKMEMNDAR